MGNRKPTEDIKEEIVSLLENLLEEAQKSHSSPISIKWDNKTPSNLNVKLDNVGQLASFLPEFTPDLNNEQSPESQLNAHIRYLLINVLKDRLNLLEDHRPQSRISHTKKGLPIKGFTLKLWYSPESFNHIDLNILRFKNEWNRKNNLPIIEAIKHNFPRKFYSEFIAHQAEVKEILELCKKSHPSIICIYGMGGIGKTSLALEVSHYQDLYQDKYFTHMIFTSAQPNRFIGVYLTDRWIVERNIEYFLDTIFRCFNAQNIPKTIKDKILLLRELIQGKSILIILDNVETFEDQKGIIGLLNELPDNVKVIITSRVNLGIGRSIELQFLSSDDSDRLIRHLANNQSLKLTREQVEYIYDRTKGLPLAISYTIAQIAIAGFESIRSVSQTVEELGSYCFSELIKQLKEKSDNLPYHVLLALSLFVDSASGQALRYILNIQENKFKQKGLKELQKIYLVQSLDDDRYEMHSLTQEYTQLELNQRPEYARDLRDRWLNFYKDLVEPYQNRDFREWYDDESILMTEWINLRSVVDWCIEQDRYDDVLYLWQSLNGFTLLKGYWSEREQWLEWLEKIAHEQEDKETIAKLQYHRSLTVGFLDQSDRDGQAMELAQKVWLMRDVLDINLQFDLIMYIASLYIRRIKSNDQEKARDLQLAQESLNIGKQILNNFPDNFPPSSRYDFQVYYYQGEIQLAKSQLVEAYNNYDYAYQIAHKNKLKRYACLSNAWMSYVLIQQERFTEAEPKLTECIKLGEKYHDRRGTAMCQMNLAKIKKALNKIDESRKLAQKAQEKFQQLRMVDGVKEIEKFLNQLES